MRKIDTMSGRGHGNHCPSGTMPLLNKYHEIFVNSDSILDNYFK